MGLLKLGEPLSTFKICSAAYQPMEDGGYRIYTVAQGKPCRFVAIDALTGQMVTSLPLTGSNHSWGICVTSDGSVYVGGDGFLYRYDPRSDTLDHLGQAIDGEIYFWRMAADESGNVYGGTYPGGKVFQYRPADRAFRDYGTLVPGNQYARSMDIGPNGKLYIGTGAMEAAIIELDTATGETIKLPMPEGQEASTFVYDLDVHEDKLFARFTESADLLVYDLTKRCWIHRIDQAMGLDVSPPGKDRRVYLFRDQKLHALHLDTLELTPCPLAHDEGAYDFGWIAWPEPGFPGQSLISMYSGGYFIYNPATHRAKHVEVELDGSPVGIQSIALGGDGKLYLGGYFAGGFASYDPVTGAFSPCERFGQSENLFWFKDRLYLGVYPGARIYQYDPDQPWEHGVNPRLLFSLKRHGQDRPFTFAAAGDRLVIGTIPAYGKLGGAIAFYDPDSDRYECFAEPVPEHSVIALCYTDGLVIGGSSAFGGLGCPPSGKDGMLFVWDRSVKKTVWEGVPVPGEKAVAALAPGENGMIWGMTTGSLFAFNLTERRIERIIDLFPPLNWEGLDLFWRGVYLQYEENTGMLYGNCLEKLFQFNVRTGELQVLAEGGALFARDSGNGGIIYTVKGTGLYEYRPVPS